jgi:hypothetical protein
MKWMMWLVFASCWVSHSFAVDVFIDPSRATKCPGLGTHQEPYCDWGSVGVFTGGNRYLQKSGTTFHGSVKIVAPTGASAARPVFIGAYDQGGKPRIRVENALPDAMNPGKWRRAYGDVWAFSTEGFSMGNPAVLLLDKRRAFGAAQRKPDLCRDAGSQIVEWFHGDDVLYLCSPNGNPADVYSSICGMQRFGNEPWVPLYIENQQHVVIDGLMVEGGNLGAIEIRGDSSHIEIRNSIIGLDSPSGVRVHSLSVPVRNLDIHDNVIDSGIRWGVAGYEPHLSGEGVHFIASVQDSRIYRNQIIAWSHNGVYLDGHLPESLGVNRNIIFDNEFHCGSSSGYFDYCRPFGMDGFKVGSVEGNVFFRNVMHDFSVRAQINGNSNYVVGNVCYNTINSKARTYPTGQCFSFQPYVWSRDNVVANNTMVNTADVAVQFLPGKAGVSSGHRVINNIMYGCARTAISSRRNVCIELVADSSVGPQLLVDNVMYNHRRPVRVRYRRDWSEDLDEMQVRDNDTVSGNRVADPKLRDPVHDDFSLLAGSPAISAGQPVEVPGLNFSGNAVNIGALQSPAGVGWAVPP